MRGDYVALRREGKDRKHVDIAGGIMAEIVAKQRWNT